MKSILKKFAPFIYSGLAAGGPLGLAAATALKSTGVLDDKTAAAPTLESVTNAIATIKDPDAMLKIQQAEQQYQLDCGKLGLDSLEKFAEMMAADRDSARQREIKTGDSITPRLIAAFVCVMWLIVTIVTMVHVIPSQSEPYVLRTLGTLDMAVALILGYYFGSSVGHSDMTKLVAHLTGDKEA